MSKTIRVNVFDVSSINSAVHELQMYAVWVQRKANELAERLADYGLQRVEIGYAGALYDGDKDVEVTLERREENTDAIVASGATVLILEFGAGVTYGNGHPQAAEFGYGPGTYPGQTHAFDPKGWWYTGSDGKGHHSYGNVPSMVMYITGIELEQEVERVAKEVFST
jgi:hypothetical protein